MTAVQWTEFVVILACFVLAGLASGTETALTSVGRLRVRYLAEEGSRSAGILQRLQRDPNRFLSTVLLVNTVALIVASSATTLLTDDLFHGWGVPQEDVLWLALLVSLLLSVVLLLLAEDGGRPGRPHGDVLEPGAVGGDHPVPRAHWRARRQGAVPD